MIAASFPQSNVVYDKPLNMSRDDCEALSVFKGKDANGVDVIISCWKPTQEELDEILATKRVWCWHFGNHLQPHCVTGTNPFGD